MTAILPKRKRFVFLFFVFFLCFFGLWKDTKKHYFFLLRNFELFNSTLDIRMLLLTLIE